MIMAAAEYNNYNRIRTHKKFFSTLIKPPQLFLGLIMWVPLISPAAQEPSKSNYVALNSANYAAIPAQSSAIPANSLAKYEAISLAMSPASAISPAISPSSGSDGGGSSSSLQQIWIVQGNSTGKITPNCSDLCVMEFNNESSFSVNLQPCEGLSPSELWFYDPLSLSITINLGGVMFCIDASDPQFLQLSSCRNSSTQKWLYNSQTMRFQGISSSPQASPLYLFGQIRQPSDWGSGKNNYSLQLSAENSLDLDEFKPTFTLIPFIDPLSNIEPSSSNPSSDGGNLVSNGGFEHCNKDPQRGYFTISNTQPFYLCFWYVLTNEVEYSGTNLWQPEDGTHSLHLNSANTGKPASVFQMIKTRSGTNYTLGFYMAGNPDLNCGDTNKTMKVEVVPSSLAEQELWVIDVSKAGAGELGYIHVYPMAFTAHGDYINLTFSSLTAGGCGPIIDNITVLQINGPLPPLINPHTTSLAGTGSRRSSMPTYARALLGIAVLALVIIAVASLLIVRIKRKKPVNDDLRGMSDKGGDGGDSSHGRWWESFKLEEAIGGNGGRGSGIEELKWRQLEKATRNFTTIVGEGGFSTVYRAELGGGRVGAVKMEKTRDRSRQIFKQELSVLARLHHPNLVNLIGFCNEREEGILVFEYMAHGSLHHRLHPPAHQMYMPLSWKKRIEVAQQVACALHYLHDEARPAVVHGDIKSANVLLDEDDNAKLCDFGFASKAGPNSSIFHSTVASVKGSLGYLDPQYLKNGRLSSKSDVYSFGVLLIELITGLHAFDMHRAEALTSFTTAYVKDMDMMELIVDARLSGIFDKSELRSLCNVARLCVQEDGASRPTMVEVVFQLSSNSTGLSSTTIDQVQEDGNAFSSFSENVELCVYNSFDSDSIITKHLESMPHSM